MLDKTGTVTEGRMRLAELVPAAGFDRAELLRFAAAAESGSEHPIAKAIVERAAEERESLPPLEQFQSRAGLGVEAVVAGKAVLVGRPALLPEWGLALPPELADAQTEAEAAGQTVVVCAWDGAVGGLLVVSDRIKGGSVEAVAELKRLGLQPVLLTGDNPRAAAAVAAEVGIERVRAEVLPHEKSAEIGRLQDDGEIVAMVGDGVNDAPALARADLGLSIGTGTDVAIEASDITLVSGDLRAAVDAIGLSRRVLATIKGNLFWAFAYNVAAIPLAAAGLLNPMVAAAAMGLLELVRRLQLVAAPPLPQRPRRRRDAEEGVAVFAGTARVSKAATTRYGYVSDKESLIKRLHRIEGQVRGIERMVEKERYCIDILTQISAVNTALESLALKILDDHVSHCVAGALASGDQADAAKKTEELLAAVRRFAKTT